MQIDSSKKFDLADAKRTLNDALTSYLYEAIVTDFGESSDEYIIDVYEKGYVSGTTGNDPTRNDLTAHASTCKDVYDVGDLVRVRIFPNDLCMIISEDRLQLIKVVATGPNGEADFTSNHYWGQFQYLSSTSGLTYHSYPAAMDINDIVDFINNGEVSHGQLQLGDYYYIKWEYDQHSPIPNRKWILVGAAAKVTTPSPTQRYQVFTPIDDTLVPIWTAARFIG